jgi:integrase
MATIVRTDSQTWKALVRKVGWPSTSKTFRTKRSAEDWARRTEDEMVQGVFLKRSPVEKMSLADALDRYEKEIVPTKKASTQIRDARRIKLLKIEFGKYSLSALSSDIVADYRDRRLSSGKSNSTVRLELALLGHLYSVAIKEWGIALAYNPIVNIRKPSSGPGRNHRISKVDHDRLSSALSKYSNPMLEWVYIIALETCMRQGEILNLRVQDVDLTRRIVSLRDTKNGSPRTIPLSKEATRVFKEALEYPMRPKDCALIFFGEPGRNKMRGPYQLNKAWLAIKQEIGLRELRFHDLRHEAISRLVEAGLSDQEVAAISGHKSAQMLMHYTHLRSENLVSKLDNIDR